MANAHDAKNKIEEVLKRYKIEMGFVGGGCHSTNKVGEKTAPYTLSLAQKDDTELSFMFTWGSVDGTPQGEIRLLYKEERWSVQVPTSWATRQTNQKWWVMEALGRAMKNDDHLWPQVVAEFSSRYLEAVIDVFCRVYRQHEEITKLLFAWPQSNP